MGKGISTGSGSPSRKKFAPAAAAASLFVCLGVPLAHAVGTEAEILQQTSDTFSSSASTSLTLAVPFMSLIPTINEYFPFALLLTATFFTSSRSDAKLSSFIDKQTATNAEISKDVISLKNVVNKVSEDVSSLQNVVNKTSRDILSLQNVVNKASKDISSTQVSIKSLSKEVKAIGNKVGFLYEENFRDRSAESHR
jgi:methyl-accepting chemotaxis protein